MQVTMRLVKLLVHEDDRESVLSVLDEEEIDYLLYDGIATGTGDGSGSRKGVENGTEVLVEFPLPDQAVEYVRDRLDESGLEDEYVITVTAETAQTKRFESLEERFITGTEEGDSISPEELRTTALNLHPDPLPYYAMTLLSAIVAVAGLLLNSAALVVGAMVMAPQVGSALTASVGATIGDWRMLQRGVRAQILSLSLAIIGSTVFGIGLQLLGFVPPIVNLEMIAQIGERTSPGMLTLAVGVAAGIAGATGVATALPVSIVGVMIAAALIPAAAAAGIGLAWNSPSVAVGAAVLLVANLVAVNAAGFATLWAFGYRSTDNGNATYRGSPSNADEATIADRIALPSVSTALLVVAFVGVLLFTGTAFAAQASFENDVNSGIDEVLDEEEYADLNLVRSQMDFVMVPGSDPPGVQVVVERPADQRYPALAERLGETLAASTDREVAVRVEFVDRQRYDPGGDGTD